MLCSCFFASNSKLQKVPKEGPRHLECLMWKQSVHTKFVLFFLISLTGFQLVWCWYDDENLVQGLLSFLCWYTSRCHVICCRFAKARKAISISESRCVFTIISAVRLSCKQWPEAEAEMLVLSSLFFLWQDVSKLNVGGISWRNKLNTAPLGVFSGWPDNWFVILCFSNFLKGSWVKVRAWGEMQPAD